jgi:hypothetical protein
MSSTYWHRLFRHGPTRTPQVRCPARRLRTVLRDAICLEELESRIVPTLPLPGPVAPVALPLPAPLVPGPGDSQILENVLKMSVTNRHVLDHLPVPYVIDVSATNPVTGKVVTTIVEGQAHKPIKIDADQSKSTGQGGSGFDIQVEIDAFVDPTPHLVMTIDRLGNAPYAQNLSVVVAFPFAGFDLEPGLPSSPNLVMGFQTRAAGNTVGGHAPLEEVITLTPGILAGTSHSLQATMVTTGADNPLSFILGNLDGTNVTGTLNAAGLRAYVENVPSTISLNVATVESPLGAGAINSSFALNWQASAASFVQMDYLENLTNPATASGPDFNTSLTANPMPTNEQFALALSEAGGTLTLSQHANAAVSQMTFQKTRSDALAIVGNGSGVPTQTDLTLKLAGSATLTDNANISSLAMQAAKTGGFAGTAGFLGYNVGTVGVAVTNAPSMSTAFTASGSTRTFSAAPAVAGNTIGSVELLASSDSPAAVQLPTRWSNPAWDVLSMIDIGTADTLMPPVFAPGATAAARLLNLLTGTSTLNTAPLGTAFDVTTTTATPLQSYLRTTPTSKLTPGHDDEITCELVNIPAGETKFFFNGPTDFGVTTIPPTSIGDIHCFGHIDSLAFDIDAGGVPAVFAFKWDPDSILTILAQDGHGGNAFLGHLAAFLADTNGISLFPDAGVLFGTKLKEARLRVDNIPTFTGTWVVNDIGGNTSIQFNTVAPGLFADGVQMAVSTQANDPALANPLTPAAALTADYATFNDAGAGARNLAVGVLGIDSFSYAVANASDMVHIIWDDNRAVPFNLNVGSITGGVYFAGAQVTLTNNIALVPSHLDFQANLDPMIRLTGTNFIPSIDLTFDHNQGLPAGSTLTLHADNLPPVIVFDFEPTLGTFSVLAQDTLGNNNQTIGDLLFDLEDPTGLPGTSTLLGAPIEQARLRLDNVPSFQATYNTTASGTTIGLMSVAPGLSIGATQLQISTLTDLLPPGPPTPGSNDFVTISDPGGTSVKHLVAELFGLTQFTYSTVNASKSTSIVMVQDVARQLTATVVSNNGNFFPGHNVDAAVVVNLLPTSITLTSNFTNQLSYSASSGIGALTVGGSTPGTDGTFDTTKFSLNATALPAVFGFDFDAAGHLTISAETVGLAPDSIGNLTVHLHDANGFAGSGTLLGDVIREAAIRLDAVPSFHATWSTSGNTAIHFDADNGGTFLGGAQVALSTQVDLVLPLSGAGPAANDYVTLVDMGTGGEKQLQAGVFDLGHFSYAGDNSQDTTTLHFQASAAHELIVTINSTFGGKFFGNSAINVTLTVNAIPAQFDMTLNLDPSFQYTASSPISSLTLVGSIDQTNDSVANGADINFGLNGLPSQVAFNLILSAIPIIAGGFDVNNDGTVDSTDNATIGGVSFIGGALDLNGDGVINSADTGTFMGVPIINGLADVNGDGTIDGSDNGSLAGAQLLMNGSISSVNLALTAHNNLAGMFGSPYKLLMASLTDIPAHWMANWGGGSLLVEALDASNNPQPMGQVAVTLSTSAAASDNAANIMPFQVSGPGGARINYSPYLQEIDNRYFSLGTGAPVTLAQLQNIYNNAQVLTAGEDHAVARINSGSLAFADAQFTGFQKIVYQPNANGGHFEFDAPTPGPHPFLAGAGLDSNFLVAHIDNIPDAATLDIDMAAHSIHFHSSASAGTIDLYYGPQGMAQDSDTAVRAVLENTPSDVKINWSFGFPNGNASFVASNPFTLLFLAQDGSSRLVGGARLQELDASYGMDILPLNVHLSTTFLVPTNLTVTLFDAHAAIDVGNSGVPVDGFFNLYTMKSGPDALTPSGPAPGANEYIPELTFMMKDFTNFSIDVSVGLSITILPVPGIIHPSVNVNVSLTGTFIFDVWQNSNINDTLFGAIGYVDAPDYTDNSPIQLVPVDGIILQNHGGLTFSFEGFSDLSDHFDPLA